MKRLDQSRSAARDAAMRGGRPLVPLCSPRLANGEHPMHTVADLRHHTLIHSEGCLVGWRDWMRLHRKVVLDVTRGPRFDRFQDWLFAELEAD